MTLRSIALLAALGAAAPAPDARGDATRLLGCSLALAEADSLLATLPRLRVRDDSRPGTRDINQVYDSAGATILGMPARGLVRSAFVTARQTEHAFATHVDRGFDEARRRLLEGNGQKTCYEAGEIPGERRCLVHLRADPGPEHFDVDVQVGERGGKVQFECLYGDLPH